MYDQIIVLEYESVCFRIHIACSTLWDTVDDNCYATNTKSSKSQKMQKKCKKKCKKMQKIFDNPKISKIENINEKGKQLNPHASISTLCLLYVKALILLSSETYL